MGRIAVRTQTIRRSLESTTPGFFRLFAALMVQMVEVKMRRDAEERWAVIFEGLRMAQIGPNLAQIGVQFRALPFIQLASTFKMERRGHGLSAISYRALQSSLVHAASGPN